MFQTIAIKKAKELGYYVICAAVGGDLPGNEIQSPMAKVILGGLLSSTLLNGFVIPVMYLFSHKN